MKGWLLKVEVIVSEQDNQDILRQGIEAAREGKKSQAHKLFKQVVELEADNEKGWFWLAFGC